jgi:meso-butanediol dehydrogenase / (S,S)-butanediol dehydrogenase / diacetyl reductase
MSSHRFDGRVALVTGAGSGIGRAVVLRLSEEGARVLAVDVVEERLAEVRGHAPDLIVGHAADIADPAACAAAIGVAIEAFGRLDVLANVAGIFHAGRFADHTHEQYRRVLAVNLDGPFFLSQAAMPHLLEAAGNIVNVVSNSAIQGVPYASAYATSKGGLLQLTRALAVEYLKQPLRVNAVAPAGTRTNLALNASFPPDMDIELVSRMGGHRGIAEPDDIAAVVAFLASDEARAVTGAVYTVDNGLTVS